MIIVGPTASGKTDLAIRLAERFGGEIVNADSMQVYRGMDIGTAKPPLELRQSIPHHLIDIVGPEMNFSAADFRREAARAIDDITGRGKAVFIVGGTGLYIRALLQGLVDSPGGAGVVRQELEETAKREGNEALLRELFRIDPDYRSASPPERPGADHPRPGGLPPDRPPHFAGAERPRFQR